MAFLQQLADSSTIPLLTAFILGIIMATSPCPLALNITATAWLSKDISDKRRVLFNGVFYMVGGIVSYTTLASLIYFGASKFHLARWLQHIDGFWVGISLIVFGILMFDFLKFDIPFFNKITAGISKRNLKRNYWNAFLIGVVFAIAFCPNTAVLFFGGLIPLTIASAWGLVLPLVFAVAACLPVVGIAWLLAYSVANIGKFYNQMQSFEKWFKRMVAVIFIGVGIYLMSEL
jgi:Cytochrome c biogenesis protein